MNLTHHHLLKLSPWPFTISFAAFGLAIGFVSWAHGYQGGGLLSILSFLFLSLVFALWCRDVLRESLFLGYHTNIVKAGASNGFILFIVSEIFFFGAFIWSYFYAGLAPTFALGGIWPPVGLEAINPWSIPLLNTIVLLSSGATATWAHNALLAEIKSDSWFGLFLTVALGICFTGLQTFEYLEANFTLADSSYGTVFFSTLSLHGAHVIIGTLFLYHCLKRVLRQEFSGSHHIALESALLYWHFVDIVWLVVFTFFYIWAY